MPFNKKVYKEILDNIREFGNNNIKIVAVSKNHPIESVKKALDIGVRIFGENRVQEAQSKFFDLKKKYNNIELHLTGSLQTNKVKAAIDIFDIFQTLDREKLAKEFGKYRNTLLDKKFFIQVNIGNEKNKSGIDVALVDDFIFYCKEDLKLNVIGLMCIPPIDENPISFFKTLKKISDRNNLKNLSMGMSGDYQDAIKCGASYIRVGTKLFGQRVYDY